MPPSARPRYLLALTAALVWTMLILGLYYWVPQHKPITPDLARSAGGALLDLAVAALFAVVSGGLGRRLLRRVDLAFLSTAERLAATGLLGLSAVSLLVILVGALALTWWSMAALFLLLIALTLPDLIAWARELVGWLRGGLPHQPWPRFLSLAAVIMLLLALLLALLPPTKWDVLTYHLAGAEQYVERGRFYAVEHNHFLGFPQLVDSLYAAQLALTGRLTGSAPLHWVIGAFLLMAAGGYAARRTSGAAGWVAVNVLLVARTVWLELTLAYSDLFAMALAVLALAFAEQWDAVRRSPNGDSASKTLLGQSRAGLAYLILIGICAGLGMGTKYTVLWMGLVFGLLVIGLARREGLRAWLAYGGLYALTALVVVAPWLIRNVIWYGSPTYPLVFEAGEMDRLRQDWYSQPESGLIYGPNAWQIPVLPITATFLGVEGAGMYGTDIGPLFLILTPLLLLAWAHLTPAERVTVRRALGVVAGIGLLWALSATFGSYVSLQTRLVLYLFGPLAVVCGIGLEALRRLPKKPFDFSFTMQALVSLTLVFMVSDAIRFLANSGIQRYFSGEKGYRDTYLLDALGWHYETMRQVNDLPPGTTVRFLWEPRYLYCDNERLTCHTDSLMDAWYYARRTVGGGSPAVIADRWQSEGADYLLVYEYGREFECGTYCGSDNEGTDLYTRADWDAWDIFVSGELEEIWRNGNSDDEIRYILYRWRDALTFP